MGVQVSLGESPINGRRPRKEEFNPFAKDAQQQHRRKRDERERQAARRPAPTQDAPTAQPADMKADFQRKQREAMEKLEQKGDVSAPAVAPAPVSVDRSKNKEENLNATTTREDRLAELRRKSEELKKSAPSTQVKVEQVAQLEEQLIEPVEPVEAALLQVEEEATEPAQAPKRVKNVFKQIETKVESKQDRRRGRRRMDKKGGGRQKQQKKLNRQKYLEYKYAARDILDNPNVPEEHRSNVLGQVWAKGERLGIDDSLEFIEQKEAELVLPEAVAEELRNLVKSMTTRR